MNRRPRAVVVVTGSDPAPSGPPEPVTGVQSVTYKLKGVSTGEFTGRGSGVATVTASGTTTVTGTSLDWAGNASPEGTAPVKIETRQPTITIFGLEEDDRVDQGKPFSFRYQCDDRDSGVLSCAATLTGASGFDCSIKSQQVGLLREIVDDLDDLADIVRALAKNPDDLA